MRAGIATVQHTLTAEASTVLKRAIADAQQRGHAQVTPLHVASSLLTAPSSMLQQACIQSHRHVPHPLQCRALDLCFNVALERLPATIQQQQHSTSPQSSSLSNALVAALKRAQAHQRRGCPEQQQVPLLAVKVEMEQLVISILDDPSVSRVMREAGFSSTRAKNSLETSCFSSSSNNNNPLDDIRSRINRDQQQQQQQQQQKLQNPQLSGASTFHSRSSMLPQPRSSQDAQSAMAILARTRKQRNPVLIGDDLSTSFVLKEIWKTIRQQDQPPHLKNARVLFVEKGFGSCAEITQRWFLQISKAEEESSIHPVVVFLGNLTWCIHHSPVIVSSVLGELAKIITRAEGKRLWLVSSASSQLYMRFLAQHPCMETRLGFQPLPVSVPSIRPRLSPGDSQTLSRTFPKMLFRIPDDEEQLSCCTDCTAKFEHESLTLLQEQRTESVSSSGDSLPNWMKNSSNIEVVTPQPPILQTQEVVRDLRRKWNRNCQTLHNSLKTTLPNLTDCSSSSGQSSPEGKLASSWLSLSTITEAEAPPSLSLGLSSTGLNFDHRSKKSKVTTDLVLGTPNSTDAMRFHQQRLEDSSGCTRRSSADEDTTGFVKKVFKGISDKVPWQTDAAGKVASTVARCWGRERKRARMIFAGADFMGKRKVAKALVEEVYGAGNNLVLLSLNPQDRKTPRRLLWEAEATEHHSEQEICRGKTVTDRIADAVKSKPFSVVLLEDLDEADVGVKKTLMKSLERGKIQHSSGSEVGIGNAIVILTTKSSGKKTDLEEKLECVEGSEIRVTVEKRIDSEDESCGRNKCEVSVVDCEGGLLIREEVKCVGEKRKGGLSSWGDKLEGLMLVNRSRKKMAIDLNLGLSSCESWGGGQGGDEDGGAGMFDEVVEFGEVEVGVMAEVVMERFERLACGYRVCVEMDVKVVEMMVAAVWGGGGGGLERWFKEMVEDVVIAGCDGTPGDCWTVRLVAATG